jgi:acyl CoA:acetate/3-ketoacid CoA transferase beta subunit
MTEQTEVYLPADEVAGMLAPGNSVNLGIGLPTLVPATQMLLKRRGLRPEDVHAFP